MSSSEDGLRRELLSDSEATLRQVKSMLSDFDTTPGEEGRADTARTPGDGSIGLGELVRVLVATYSEIMEVIENLRQSRGLLEQASMERLKNTHMKLAEVSSATEVAATGMLDGLDRALTLVDRLDSTTGSEQSAESLAARDDLRQELHTIMDLLQFQDITAQQLGYASSVLFDVEQRMVRLSQLFDSGIGLANLDLEGRSAAENKHVQETCDPEASTLNAEGRQALADEIFTVPGRSDGR